MDIDILGIDLAKRVFQLHGADRGVSAKYGARKHPALCQKNQAIDGVGAIAATAMVTTVDHAKEFKNGRHLSAWLGLVPR